MLLTNEIMSACIIKKVGMKIGLFQIFLLLIWVTSSITDQTNLLTYLLYT